mmetsp:Transcript_2588/g.4033  ORF Transcript_2588/g.4033 Transcript_2588/m.4033 type:complete len:84 (+) Transcript_2588:1004-1255(+)
MVRKKSSHARDSIKYPTSPVCFSVPGFSMIVVMEVIRQKLFVILTLSCYLLRKFQCFEVDQLFCSTCVRYISGIHLLLGLGPP